MSDTFFGVLTDPKTDKTYKILGFDYVIDYSDISNYKDIINYNYINNSNNTYIENYININKNKDNYKDLNYLVAVFFLEKQGFNAKVFSCKFKNKQSLFFKTLKIKNHLGNKNDTVVIAKYIKDNFELMKIMDEERL